MKRDQPEREKVDLSFICLSIFEFLEFTALCRMPHKCHGNAGKCPTRSNPIWELPINELDRRDDPTFDERLSGCHLVSSCSNIYDKDQFARLLRHNFNRHYSTNRAPLSLSFDAAWLKVNKGFTKVLAKWVKETVEEHNDVYFVTGTQVRMRYDSSLESPVT